MKRSVLLLILAVVYAIAAANLYGQVSEETVRLTYAKAIFANQVGLIEKNVPFNSVKPIPDLPSIQEENNLTFALSNFRHDDVVG